MHAISAALGTADRPSSVRNPSIGFGQLPAGLKRRGSNEYGPLAMDFNVTTNQHGIFALCCGITLPSSLLQFPLATPARGLCYCTGLYLRRGFVKCGTTYCKSYCTSSCYAPVCGMICYGTSVHVTASVRTFVGLASSWRF